MLKMLLLIKLFNLFKKKLIFVEEKQIEKLEKQYKRYDIKLKKIKKIIM